MKFISILLLLQLSVFTIFAQEEVLIFSNMHLTQDRNLKSTQEDDSDTVLNYLPVLPFYDDFAYTGSYPDQSRWHDKDAYVNNCFATDNPVTIGAATLDALDEEGLLYSNANTKGFSADRLTSQPLNLDTYETRYRSDYIYSSATTDDLLSGTLFFYNKILEDTVAASLGYWVTAADTLYVLNADSTAYEVYEQPVYYTTDPENDERVTFTDLYNDTMHVQEYTEDDSLALSFWYQAGGVADEPEEDDMLYIEFYVPSTRVGLFINEISKSTIELYNATESLVNIKGYFIGRYNSADSLEATNQITDDYLLSPYGFCTLDMSTYLGNDSLTDLYLFDDDTVFVDSLVTTINFTSSYTVGRYPDGSKNIQLLTEKTLGEENPNWTTVDTMVNASTDFIYRKIYLESKYLKKGFRFRFRNIASLSDEESHARNEDIWNIDDVWLDKDRGAGVNYVSDISFVSGLDYLITDDYKAIPTTHIQIDDLIFEKNIPYHVVNKRDITSGAYTCFSYYRTGRNDGIIDSLFYRTFLPDEEKDTVFNFKDDDEDIYNINIPYDEYIDSTFTEEGKNEYIFKQYLIDYNGIGEYHTDYRWNDTVRTSLVFDNYYAYDDGSAEAGYGLRESESARCAYQFSMFAGDTLRGIDIFFNNTLYSSTIYYSFCVWNDDNGEPGDMIVKKTGLTVESGTSLNEFQRILIADEDILTDDEYIYFDADEVFYVGWQQTQDLLINVGVDLNSSISNKVFYNTSYQWFESIKDVALMIRPLVGDKIEDATSVAEIESTNTVVLYPNPASSTVNIEGVDADIVSVKNIYGSSLITIANTNVFDVSELSTGLYLVEIESDGNRCTRKLLVRH